MRSNSNRNGDLLALGALGVLGFFAIKALTTPSRRPAAQRQRALPQPRRDYLPLFSTHGSDYRLGTADNEVPAGPWMTFAEAVDKARRFILSADAIEGHACVLDVRSGERINAEPAAAQQ